MKKILVISSFIFAFGFCGLNQVSAQVSVNVNINLDKQPSWGPTGYDYAGYYYFPDINVYYDVTNSLFYFLSGNRWSSNQYLPSNYGKYDLYTMHKVVMNNEKQPWLENTMHKKEYSQYKGDRNQEVIRNSNSTKYNSSRTNDKPWVSPSNGQSRNSGQSREGSNNQQGNYNGGSRENSYSEQGNNNGHNRENSNNGQSNNSGQNRGGSNNQQDNYNVGSRENSNSEQGGYNGHSRENSYSEKSGNSRRNKDKGNTNNKKQKSNRNNNRNSDEK